MITFVLRDSCCSEMWLCVSVDRNLAAQEREKRVVGTAWLQYRLGSVVMLDWHKLPCPWWLMCMVRICTWPDLELRYIDVEVSFN